MGDCIIARVWHDDVFACNKRERNVWRATQRERERERERERVTAQHKAHKTQFKFQLFLFHSLLIWLPTVSPFGLSVETFSHHCGVISVFSTFNFCFSFWVFESFHGWTDERMDGWMSFTPWAHHLACWAGTLVGAQCLVALVGTTFRWWDLNEINFFDCPPTCYCVL